MSDSIKDRFLKEHELSMEDLEKVSGGDPKTMDKTIKMDGVTFNIDNKVAPHKPMKVVVFTK